MPHSVRHDDLAIAVLLPCYNEEQTIGDVVRCFRETLPAATIYVYDNNSQRPDRAAGPRGRRDRHSRAAPGQGQCGAAHVRRHRCRHLPDGRWRRHLCPGGCAAIDQHASDRALRHGGGHAARRYRRRRPGRPRLRQPRLQRPLQAAVRHAISPTSSPATASSPVASSRASPPSPAVSRSRPKCRCMPRS